MVHSSCLSLLLSSSPPPSLSLPVAVWGAGTIRKAQNLLKQYSQHGLDGKKATNLTPLEGNSSLPLFSRVGGA